MKYQLIRAALLFLIAYSADAQSVLDLHNNTAQIESFTSNNLHKGSGILSSESGIGRLSGTFRDSEGQVMEYASHYEFRDAPEGLEISLSYYLDPFIYSPKLEKHYEGSTVLLPAIPYEGQVLQESAGTFTFSLKGMVLITERVKLTGRKVNAIEEIEFRGVKSKAYIISSIYEAEMVRKTGVSRSTATLTEWYIPGVGIIKSERLENNSPVIFKLK